jgi:hypothetical protein
MPERRIESVGNDSVDWREELWHKVYPTIFAGKHLAGPALLPSVIQLNQALKSQEEELYVVIDAGLRMVFRLLNIKIVPLDIPEKAKYANKCLTSQIGMKVTRILGELTNAYDGKSCRGSEIVDKCVSIISHGSNVLLFPQLYADLKGENRWRIGIAKIIRELIPNDDSQSNWGFNVGLINLNAFGITSINILDREKLRDLGIDKQIKPHDMVNSLRDEYLKGKNSV